MDVIKQYYLLNTTKIGHKRHMIDTAQDGEISALFSKKDIGAFFRRANNAYIAKETIVGGHDRPKALFI